MIGSVTLANMRLSLVDGNSFIDFSSDVFGDHIGDKLIVYDSAGKKAIGYIKSVGSGETYGSNLTNANFADSSNWTTTGDGAANWVVSGGVATWTGGGGSGYLNDNSITPSVGGCYLLGYKINSITRGANHQATMGGISMAYVDATGTYSKYGAATSTAKWKVYAANGQTSLVIDDVVGKQVLTPSSTGVTITSTAGGTTYNWASIEAGFNYNDASGYTYSIVASRDILYEDNDILVMDIKDAPTTNGTSTIIYASDFNCKKLSIENIRHSIYGVKLVLSFDATTDDKCLVITGNDTIDIGNPILNPMSAGYTGDIVLTTLGVTEDSTYNLIIKLRKY